MSQTPSPQQQSPQYLPPPPPPPPGPAPVLNYNSGVGSGVQCPYCGCPTSKKVSFTFWGGIIGPRLLHHVKCTQCKKCYNGKTGKPNTKAILIYTLVGLAAGIVIFAVLIFANH